jgi:hypothetical protein
MTRRPYGLHSQFKDFGEENIYLTPARNQTLFFTHPAHEDHYKSRIPKTVSYTTFIWYL